ncbi:MAG: hypothetical protein A4E20_10730 [Nitrospira sp. SG-bin2]|uniref:hypothetical protein n=1 Tax=Nitrospira cf. moscoviensis SBR1015 TaxID=96242 RepID=UPI000A0E89AC|nr:hypothetical protein [Nitrospira cf. moscoviensis SBR1015]OQW34486.1 MAG: hypothetical protein A4E20_10730 [Nitrospira sp. SG-bin2]
MSKIDELAKAAEAAGYDVEVDSDGDLWIQNLPNYVMASGESMSGGWHYDEYDFDYSQIMPLDPERAMKYLGGDLLSFDW